MCLRVDANGRGEGAGTHISVHVCLMNAEHENARSKGFPDLSCDLNIGIYNCFSSNYSIHKIVHGLLLKGSVFSKFKEDKTNLGYGIDQFVTHEVAKRYTNNDLLKWRVCSIHYHSSSLTCSK